MWLQVADATTIRAVPPPNGNLSAKIDEKGRLKLPARLQEYFICLGEKTVFITTLDKATARVYNRTTWEENKVFLSSYKDDPDWADDVLFIANHFGADAEMDDQGRVLVPQKLRSLLSLENESVQLGCFPGVVDIYTPANYEARMGRAVPGLADKVRSLRQKGLK